MKDVLDGRVGPDISPTFGVSKGGNVNVLFGEDIVC